MRSDRDVPDNMIFMPFCYAEAAANLLTNPALDPFGKIPEFKFCAVRAEKVALQSAAEAKLPLTDDCAAVERLGKQVYLLPGNPENIKITRPLDLAVAAAILRQREERNA